MKYVAKHYVKVDGRVRFPGEIFCKDYDEKAEKRLIETGAIRRADAPVSHAIEADPVIPQEEATEQNEAEPEHIEADEASVTRAIHNLCRENNMTIDQLSAYLNEDAQNAIVRGVIADKVLDFLRDNAVLEVVEKQM